jgi:hypothetical protein
MSEKQPVKKPYPANVANDRELDPRSDRVNAPQEQLSQQPGGGGAPGTGETQELELSEEARNQQQTSRKNAAESGTP